jgi:hypothetical protein
MIDVNSGTRYFSHRREVAIVAMALACLFCFASLAYGSEGGGGGAGMFPNVKGWSKDGEPETYDPETLYEYINGAADLYIAYDFKELLTLNYERAEDQGLIVDIYRHSTARNGFGIYSQERPTEGRFLSIGTEGYYDQGILNFVLGGYYVKLAGFYLGEEDELLLTSVAKEIAARLKGKPDFPEPVKCFPDSGRIAHTERYVAVNFLGHGFLHSAYTAEYEIEEQAFKLFIIEANDEEDARGMLKSYLNLARDKGIEVTEGEGFYRFKDPYYGSGGKMNLSHAGRYIWGLFSDSIPVYEFYLERIGANLGANGLIEGRPDEG